MTFCERIWDKLNDFGFYQFRIFLLANLFDIPTAIAMVLPILTHAKMNFQCSFFNHSQNATDNNSSMLYSFKQDDFAKNFTIEQTNLSFCDNCCDHKCVDIIYSTELTSIVSEWNLICDEDFVTNFINTLTMVGLFFGGFIAGQLSDQYGRKKVLYGSFILLLIFQLISGMVNSWQIYCVCRFFIGTLISSTLVANFVLPMEYSIPKWRTFTGCLGFWPVGFMVLAFLGYFIRNWRYLTISTACISIPFLVTWWFVTESPRWLFAHGQKEDAKKILKKIEECNKAPPIHLIKMNRIIQEGQEKKLQQKKYSYCHLFSTLQMCKKTLILNYGWFICCSVYYGLVFTTKNLSGNPYLNIFLSGVVELPAIFLVLAINNSFGRKKTIILLIGVAGITSFSMYFLHMSGKYEVYPKLQVVLAMLAKFGIAGGWAALQIFSAELFPTVVRSLGVASCSMSARVGAIIAIQIIKLDKISKQVPFVIFGGECLLFSALLLCLPETAGMPLGDRLESAEREFPNSPLNEAEENERMNQNQEVGKNETQASCLDNTEMNQDGCSV